MYIKRALWVTGAVAAAVICVFGILSVYFIEPYNLTMLGAGVSASIFFAYRLTTLWDEYNYKETLQRECFAELEKDYESFLNLRQVTDYNRPFMSVMWNVDGYKEMLRVGLANKYMFKKFGYNDLSGLVSFMEQDNRFQAEFWEKYGTDADLNLLSIKRNTFQDLIKKHLEKMRI